MLLEASSQVIVRPLQPGFLCGLSSLPVDEPLMLIHRVTAEHLVAAKQANVLCEIGKVSETTGIEFGYAYFSESGMEADEIMAEETADTIFAPRDEAVFFYCPATLTIPSYYLFEAMSFAEHLLDIGFGQTALAFVRALIPLAHGHVLVSLPGIGQSLYLPPLWGHIVLPKEHTILFGEIQAGYQEALAEDATTGTSRYSMEEQTILGALGIRQH